MNTNPAGTTRDEEQWVTAAADQDDIVEAAREVVRKKSPRRYRVDVLEVHVAQDIANAADGMSGHQRGHYGTMTLRQAYHVARIRLSR